MFKISKNVARELAKVLKKGTPDLSSEKGELFLLKSIPVGAIRLKIPVGDYLAYLESLEKSVRPKRVHVVPCSNPAFQIFVNAQVSIEEKISFINGRKVILL